MESKTSSAPATRSVARSTLDSTLLMGVDVLCDGQRAFIHCTRDLLLKDGMTLLASEQTADQESLVKRFAPIGRRMLAEKVETREQFAAAQEMGYIYFQGYFFRGRRCCGPARFPPTRPITCACSRLSRKMKWTSANWSRSLRWKHRSYIGCAT